MTPQTAIAHGQRQMTFAVEKADRDYTGWSSLAYAFLLNFIAKKKSFYPWEVVEASMQEAFTQPENLRAWGWVYRRAQKEGLIAKGNEMAKHPYRNGSEVRNWIVIKRGVQ